MKLKNSKIRVLLTILTLLLIVLISGCSASKYATYSKNIHVMGLSLEMSEDKANELIGEKGTSEPCIYGYEIAYSKNLLNIGFRNEDKNCRRIMTENPATDIYGVIPGSTVESAYLAIEKTDFTKDANSKYNFKSGDVALKLISTDGKIVKGVTIEIIGE